MKLLFCILLSCISFCVSNAQSLKGLVVDGATSLPVPATKVFNARTQISTFTDEQGFFNIEANFNDLIYFEAPGFKLSSRKVGVAKNGIAEMNISLFKLSIQLDEFIFRPVYSPYQLDSIERRAVYSRALARHKSSLGSPVSWVAEKLNKNSKQIFKFQKNYNYWEDQKFIDTRYTQELVGQLTRLTGDSIAFFMNAHPIPYDFARAASELELKIWIREQFKEWQKKNQTSNLKLDSLKR